MSRSKNELGRVPEIDARELVLGEEIGRGSFGTVYRGKCRGEPVAVKVVDTKDGLDQKALDAFRREVEIVSSVFSPHVCLYMGACTHDPKRLMIVTELMRTDLEKYLRNPRNKSSLTLYRRMLLARDAALGLSWLHGSDPIFIHRDVKPSNFLLDDALRCKITDFGLSQIRHRGERLVDRAGAVGTPLYMAPEVLNGAPFTEKSDVYSFGLVLWVLLTGEVPFTELDELSNDSFADAVCAGRRPPLPMDIPPALRRLIRECWNNEPAMRPTAVEVADTLSSIVLDVAILDDPARKFWRENFGTEFEVVWTEAEEPLLELFGADDPHDDSGRREYITALLRKQYETNATNKDIVSLEWFGKVVDWFGPLTTDNIDLMFRTLEQSWFHGDVATSDAERMLGGADIGSFLVRFSNQSRGYFTISRVASSNSIHHQRVQHRPLSSAFVIFDNQYTSLIELIDKEVDQLQLKIPCPGSKFANLLTKRNVAGYNEMSASQELWLKEAYEKAERGEPV